MHTPRPGTASNIPDATRAVLRHMAATLAYRAAKVLHDPPPGFDAAVYGRSTRRPVQIVAHMADLMTWAVTLAHGDYVWAAAGSDDWDVEVQRFFDGLAALDRELASSGLTVASIEKLIQG